MGKKKDRVQKGYAWGQVLDGVDAPVGQATHLISLVVPTYNCAHSIPKTLESVQGQSYQGLEVVIIDAGSTDRSLSVIKSFTSLVLKIYSVAEYSLHAMLNRGLSLANGKYVQFMVPGDYFVGPYALQQLADLAVAEDFPHVVMAGSIIRYGVAEPMLLKRPLSAHSLQQGKQPTALQACHFSRELMMSLGGFNTLFSQRSTLDLFCRIMSCPTFRVAHSRRVAMDAERRPLTQRAILLHFWDTLRILWRHFGAWQVFLWLFKQSDLQRSLRLWLRHIKLAFLGRQQKTTQL